MNELQIFNSSEFGEIRVLEKGGQAMKEWLKLIFIILAFIGFMLAAGTVGALELDNISNEQFLRQALISFGIFIFSIIGYKAVSWEDEGEMY